MLAKIRRGLLIGYAVLLAASFGYRATRPAPPVPADMQAVTVKTVDGEQTTNEDARLAYIDAPAVRPAAPVVILLHGSPGDAHNFRRLIPQFKGNYRCLAPDLPGFGASSLALPDYSFRAHARYVLQLMDKLGVQRAHLLAFSMGGGVALNMTQLAPERVSSVTMLAALSVQETEILGDYHLNRLIHGGQFAFLWGLRNLTPNFGLIGPEAVTFARNFYDSDQRPLRGYLLNYQGPMLVLHGPNDPMVPIEAARETARLAPQSEARWLAGEDHFFIFQRPEVAAPLLLDFWQRADAGRGVARNRADAARVVESQQPFDPRHAPKATGVAAVAVFFLLAFATLVSEDLTCISAGVLAAQGRASFTLVAVACLVGIFVGDILLYLAGRWLGRPALARAPLRWFVSAKAVERSSAWFDREGLKVIFLSRFLPGARLPTYMAAGVLRTSFWRFTLYFLIAAAVWTPALVWLAMRLGAAQAGLLTGRSLLLQIAVGGLLGIILLKLLVRAATWRGRRQLAAKWRRLTQWEFWPLWAFYPPVVIYVLWLGLKHRSLTLFTCANPAMPAGGVIGESKTDILRGLTQTGRNNGAVARAALLPAENTHRRDAEDAEFTQRFEAAQKFMADNGLEFPVALKPDAGQRGAGVKIARGNEDLREFLAHMTGAAIVQEYAPGEEFGVFYYRYPNEERGRVFAITEKRFPTVTGDGESTLEELILRDQRAVCLANAYFEANGQRIWGVPERGQAVQLTELGTHCLGAVFLDGGHLKTAALEDAIDRLSREYEGFYFGRYDVRAPSAEDLRAGRNLKVIELNGVTSEATSIYDPRNSVLAAWRVLFAQWRIAFEIGAQNRKRGARPAGVWRLFLDWVKFREKAA
jgi:membrane protein DedA with SNARE-associated domain/pimeloyl-ACP methyl ester carboxylesterase